MQVALIEGFKDGFCWGVEPDIGAREYCNRLSQALYDAGLHAGDWLYRQGWRFASLDAYRSQYEPA